MAEVARVGVFVHAPHVYQDEKTREAALITFLASASNIQLLGIGGAFWGLLIGLIAYAVLNGRILNKLYKSTI